MVNLLIIKNATYILRAVRTPLYTNKYMLVYYVHVLWNEWNVTKTKWFQLTIFYKPSFLWNIHLEFFFQFIIFPRFVPQRRPRLTQRIILEKKQTTITMYLFAPFSNEVLDWNCEDDSHSDPSTVANLRANFTSGDFIVRKHKLWFN